MRRSQLVVCGEATLDPEKVFAFGPFRWFPETGRLRCGKRIVSLSDRSTKVFRELFDKRALSSGVSTDTLLKEFWTTNADSDQVHLRLKNGPQSSPDESNVRQAIRSLRRKLDEFDPDVRYIETVPGGYAFVAEVTVIEDPWWEYADRLISYFNSPPTSAYPYGQLKQPAPWKSDSKKDDSKAPVNGELIERLTRQLQQPRKILLLGEYGTGKTKLCGALAHALADYRQNSAIGRLPILVPLRHLSDFDRLNLFVVELLQNLYGCNINETRFVEARRSGMFCFLLDGLDEFLVRRRESDVQSHLERLLLSFHNASLLVTARPNVFKRIDASPEGFEVIQLQLWDIDDAQTYLALRGLGEFLSELPTGTHRRLRDLIRRPLFLEMISATAEKLRRLPARELNELSLFEEYLTSWCDREVLQAGGPFEHWKPPEVYSFLAHVAYAMTRDGEDSLSEETLKEIVRQCFHDTSDYFSMSALYTIASERLILVPDFSLEQRRFTFRHDSLRSYFTAYFVYDSLRRTRHFPSESASG
jgi:GTPase SAR1 family protein